MTEILTESFCERCGTRYTFEPVVNRRRQLSAIGTLGRGIRHFVSDPGSTLDESMAVARSESEQRSTASALEAFHRTFNFCLSCRQYTCADCWNAVEGRCLSCAPIPDAPPPVTRIDTAITLPPMDLAVAPAPMHVHDGHDGHDAAETAAAAAAADQAAIVDQAAMAEAEAATAAEAATLAEHAAAAEAEAAEAAAREAANAEAAARAAQELAARDAADATAAAEAREAAETAEAAARAAATAAAEAEASRAAEAEARAAADALAQAEAAAMAALIEAEARAAAEANEREAAELAARAAAMSTIEDRDPRVAFEPGLNLDDQIAAYERDRASVGAGADPESAVAEAPEAGAEASDAPEAPAETPEAAAGAAPAAAAIEAEPEPVAAAPDTAGPALEPTAIERAGSFEPIPTAIGQPIPASAVDGPLHWPEPEVAAAAFEPAWPNLPAGGLAAPQVTAGTAEVTGRGAGLPAAETPPMPLAAHACPSCGLSLSASARFCRRCGTAQQVDAPH